jgi:hypothetical protein
MATPTAASPTTVRGPARPGAARPSETVLDALRCCAQSLVACSRVCLGRSMPFHCVFCFLAVRFALACAIFVRLFVCLRAGRGWGHTLLSACLCLPFTLVS